MSITPQALKSRPECFLRMTGVSIEVFEKIALDCTPLWEDTLIKTKHLPGRPYGLPDIEMHLLLDFGHFSPYQPIDLTGFPIF